MMTRLCSTATRRASMASDSSSAVTVTGAGMSKRSPLSVMVTNDVILSHYLSRRILDKDKPMPFDRGAALSWYARNRERSRSLFDMLPEEVYYSRPIDLRHP